MNAKMPKWEKLKNLKKHFSEMKAELYNQFSIL